MKRILFLGSKLNSRWVVLAVVVFGFSLTGCRNFQSNKMERAFVDQSASSTNRYQPNVTEDDFRMVPESFHNAAQETQKLDPPKLAVIDELDVPVQEAPSGQAIALAPMMESQPAVAVEPTEPDQKVIRLTAIPKTEPIQAESRALKPLPVQEVEVTEEAYALNEQRMLELRQEIEQQMLETEIPTPKTLGTPRWVAEEPVETAIAETNTTTPDEQIVTEQVEQPIQKLADMTPPFLDAPSIETMSPQLVPVAATESFKEMQQIAHEEVDTSNDFEVIRDPNVQLVSNEVEIDERCECKTSDCETSGCRCPGKCELPTPDADCNLDKPCNDFVNLEPNIDLSTRNAFVEVDSEAFSPNVVPASAELAEPEQSIEVLVEIPKDWRAQISDTIETVRKQIEFHEDGALRAELESTLRLLQVLRDKSEQDSSSMTSEQQKMWLEQIDALTTSMVDVNDSDSANAALEKMQALTARLSSIAGLGLANSNFCKTVHGFGQFDVMESFVFDADQKVLIYTEIENFASEQKTTEGQPTFHTRLLASYEVLDETGKLIRQTEFPVAEDIARNQRRDFYIHLPFRVRNMKPGNYELKLKIVDLNANKTAASANGLRFSVR